jgi:hypothetical protein
MRHPLSSMHILVRSHWYWPLLQRWASRLSAIIFCIVIAANSSDARTPGEIDAARDKALRQLDLQLELPTAESEDSWPWRIRLPPEFIFLALLVGLGVVAYQFKDAVPLLRGRRGREWEDTPVVGDGAPEPPTIAALTAADELASEGRFVDAMHLLLLQSLAAIRERLDEPFADSLTSREILRGTRLPDAGKASLRDIVTRVEWSYFGKHPAERSDYEACRARFDELVHALPSASAA